MPRATIEELLDAGVHFGHLKRKWNPAMAPYIFMEKNGIHIIDLNKTIAKLDEACDVASRLAKSGRTILIVGTKKQAKDIIAEKASAVNMPFVTERWPGGLLTNFVTIRKTIKKMLTLEDMINDGTLDSISKKEKLFIERQKTKLEKDFGSIADMNRLPAALLIVDVKKEHIAVAEARRLNIPTIGIVDTNSNPNVVDYPIPANDDASKSVALILDKICEAIKEGYQEKANAKAEKAEAKEVVAEEVEVKVENTENNEE